MLCRWGTILKYWFCCQKEAPVLFAVLGVIRDRVLPQVFHELFRWLQEKAEFPFTQPVHDLSRHLLHASRLSFYPNWPVQCARGRYAMDHERKLDHEECNKSEKKKNTPYFLDYLRYIVNMASICIVCEEEKFIKITKEYITITNNEIKTVKIYSRKKFTCAIT